MRRRRAPKRPLAMTQAARLDAIEAEQRRQHAVLCQLRGDVDSMLRWLGAIERRITHATSDERERA